jgi:hypothetical protein
MRLALRDERKRSMLAYVVGQWPGIGCKDCVEEGQMKVKEMMQRSVLTATPDMSLALA